MQPAFRCGAAECDKVAAVHARIFVWFIGDDEQAVFAQVREGGYVGAGLHLRPEPIRGGRKTSEAIRPGDDAFVGLLSGSLGQAWVFPEAAVAAVDEEGLPVEFAEGWVFGPKG